MPASPAPETAQLPRLPHWEQTPTDLPEAVRQIKAALRARITASGLPEVQEAHDHDVAA